MQAFAYQNTNTCTIIVMYTSIVHKHLVLLTSRCRMNHCSLVHGRDYEHGYDEMEMKLGVRSFIVLGL
jgi:hypothetical protein